MKEPFVSIQYLRGIAAAWVVCYHSTIMKAAAPFYGAHVGAFGVDIFFVISGFVMLASTEGQASVARFWEARLLRIVPMYWVATLAFVAAALLQPSLLITGRSFEPADVARSLLFVPAVNPALGDISPVYTIGWSLNYEMYFYLVFGLALLLRGVRARLLACGAAIAAVVVLGHLHAGGVALAFYSRPIVLEFVAGMALACVRRELMALPRSFAALGLAAGLALLIGSSARQEPLALAGPGAVLLVGCALAFETRLRRSPRRLAMLLGDASYSIYLFHPFFQRALFVALGSAIATAAQAWRYSLLAFVAGIAGGVAVYLLVERPVLERSRRWLRGIRGPAATVAP